MSNITINDLKIEGQGVISHVPPAANPQMIENQQRLIKAQSDKENVEMGKPFERSLQLSSAPSDFMEAKTSQGRLLNNLTHYQSTISQVGEPVITKNNTSLQGMLKNSTEKERNVISDLLFSKPTNDQLQSLSHSTALVNSVDVTSSGVRQALDTMTYVRKEVVEQVFYNPYKDLPELVHVGAGEGAYYDTLAYWQTTMPASPSLFEEGVSRDGATYSPRLNPAFNMARYQLFRWKHQIDYNLFDVQNLSTQAISYIKQVESMYKEFYEKGIVRTFFQGITGMNTSLNNTGAGILNNASVNTDNTTVPGYLSLMTDSQFQNVVAKMCAQFSANAGFTVNANRLLISSIDWFGLTVPPSSSYNLGYTRLEALDKAFKHAFGPDFKIMHSPYCDANYNNLGRNVYVMYLKDEKTARMDFPVPYTSTAFNTANNYNFQAVVYSQFSGVAVIRPEQMLYFQF